METTNNYVIVEDKKFLEEETHKHNTDMRLLASYLRVQITKLQTGENIARRKGLNKIADLMLSAQYNLGSAMSCIASIYFRKEEK